MSNTNAAPVANPTPPSLSFMPAFQLECQTRFLANNNLISEIECLQRQQVLLDPEDKGDTPLPGPPRSNKWRWRTKAQYRLNEKGELEYEDKDKKKEWRKVIPATEIFKVIADVHCFAIIHAGQDKTEAYILARYKGIPREAIRSVLSGCQPCAKRSATQPSLNNENAISLS